jgi:hypothetical protein
MASFFPVQRVVAGRNSADSSIRATIGFFPCRPACHVDKERHTLLCLIGSGKSHIARGSVIKGDDDDWDWALEGPSFPGNRIGNGGLCIRANASGIPAAYA